MVMLTVEEEILCALRRNTQETSLFLIINILKEILSRLDINSSFGVHENVYEEYCKIINRVSIKESETTTNNKPKNNQKIRRKESLMNNSIINEWREILHKFNFCQLGKVLEKIMYSYCKKHGKLENNSVIHLINQICINIKELENNEECVDIKQELIMHLIDPLLLSINSIKSTEYNLILSTVEVIYSIDQKIVHKNIWLCIITELIEKYSERTLLFLLEILKNENSSWCSIIIMYCLYVGRVNISYFIEIFSKVDILKVTMCKYDEHFIYLVQLLFIGKYHSKEGDKSVIEQFMCVLAKSEQFNHKFTLSNAKSVFNPKSSSICALGTLLYIGREMDLNVKLCAEGWMSLSSVIVLLYRRIDYALLNEALKRRSIEDIFYIYCVCVVHPSALYNIPSQRISGLFQHKDQLKSDLLLIEYFYLITKHSAEWKCLKKKKNEFPACTKCGNTSKTNRSTRKTKFKRKKENLFSRGNSIDNRPRETVNFLTIKEFQKGSTTTNSKYIKRRGIMKKHDSLKYNNQKVCSLCALGRCFKSIKIESRSILSLIVEGDILELKSYLNESAKTVNSLAVLLEKVYPQINIPVKSNQALRYLDVSEYFAYPEYIRIFPILEFSLNRINALKSLFDSDNSQKRVIWLLFLECVFEDIYGISDILTEEFHLQVIIRSPNISQKICKRYSIPREKRIIELSMEVLEEAVSVTEEERSAVINGLLALSIYTQDPDISNNILNYLSEKNRKRTLSPIHDFLKTFTFIKTERMAEKVEKCMKSTKAVINAVNTLQLYNNTDEMDSISPAELIRMKEKLFQEVSILAPAEQHCIKEYFTQKNLSYTLYEHSYLLARGSTSKIREIAEIYYDEELQIKSSPDKNSVLIDNACVYLASGVMCSIYPEKYFIFFVLTQVLECNKEVTSLEKYALVHTLEYLYVYDLDLFRELVRLCTKKTSFSAYCTVKNVQKNFMQPGFFDVPHQILLPEQIEIYSKKEIGSKRKEGLTENSSLILRKTGALSMEKEKLILAQYQNVFFTMHYNYSDVTSVVSDYFNGILPIATMRVLLFLCEVKKTEGIDAVPCTSSRDFLKIFFYAASSATTPIEYPYYGIPEMLKSEKNLSLQDQSINIEIQNTNEEIQMYLGRHGDDGFITKGSETDRKTFEVLEVDKILRAADKLTRWSEAADKSAEIEYLLTGTVISTGTETYINFLQSNKVQQRFRFLSAINADTPLVSAHEIEEILYICTRKPQKIIDALNNCRALTKSGMHSMVCALEKKWFKISAESYYVRNSKEIEIPQNTIMSQNMHRLKLNRKRNLSAALSLFKISHNIHTLKDPLFLLTEIEAGLKTELETIITDEDRAIISQNNQQKTRINQCTYILSKAVCARIEYLLNEFECHPIDILNKYVKPAEKLYFGQHELFVLESLANTCLVIYNRNISTPQAHKITRTQKVQSAILQKEHAAIKETEDYKAKQQTEVEETSYKIGIALYIKLAEKSRKLQHIISLIHLLFCENASESVIENISLDEIQVNSFLPLKQQIISKYFHLLITQNKPALLSHLSKIIVRLMDSSPFSIIYDVLIREITVKKKIRIPACIRTHAETVISQYKTIYKQGQMGLSLTGIFPVNTPILSREVKNSPVFIHAVHRTAKVLSGINKPILISIVGTDGIAYKEILKKNDDLKQDILSMQVFSYMNTVLESTGATQSIQERIRTYKIIALDKLFGIIGFIDGAEPVGTVIEGLHKKYFPQEISSSRCREIMQKCINSSIDVKTKILSRLHTEYSPALKRVFEGRGPFEYFKGRKAFTNSFAILSIATYILGLGDRHPQNILLDMATKELINIDLNLIFDQGKALSISEKIPFRMTQNIQQAIISEGVHSYEKPMAVFLGALKNSKENLLVFISILQNEPLQRWRVIQKISRENTLFSDYKSIEERMKNKLNGIENGFVLSNTAHIQCLVQRAVDISNQAAIYPGWSPWM
ncbi:ataxia telangiectasia mutated family protein [Nematocida sp. ERTm5]|nr:ataxia telangiectasia mutated family protein [Nematocida sp. ERTm5]